MTKKDGTVDLRIKRTKKAIRESFFSLLEEKDFEKISIRDLTDRAMISRNTFYLHYCDKYDLLNHICDELMRSLYSRVAKQLAIVQNGDFTIDSVATVIQKGIMAVVDERDAYSILFKGSASDVLTAKLHNMILSIFDMIRGDVEGIDGCSMEYIVSGMTGVVKYYVNHNVENIYEESKNFTIIHLSSIIEIAEKGRKRV